MVELGLTGQRLHRSSPRGGQKTPSGRQSTHPWERSFLPPGASPYSSERGRVWRWRGPTQGSPWAADAAPRTGSQEKPLFLVESRTGISARQSLSAPIVGGEGPSRTAIVRGLAKVSFH